jgi:hypothetical protein
MPRTSLEDYDIYVRRERTPESLDDCPRQLKDLFTLILSVDSLRWAYFGGMLGGGSSVETTPIMQYESELKLEADALSQVCLDPKRPNDIEDT